MRQAEARVRETAESGGNSRQIIAALAAPAIAAFAPDPCVAQDTVRVGLILPMTGPFTSTGKQIEAAVRLYSQQNGAAVAGKKIEVILRDDAAVPDYTKRIAQELIINHQVGFVAGFGTTPTALAVAPLSVEAKIPQIVMAAATSVVTERSPYIVRSSFAQAQPVVIIADWAYKNGIKKVVTVVSDFAPGYDSETFFKDAFTKAGGQVIESIRVPLQNPDFAPFLQRAADVSPDGLFVFVPAGQAGALIRQFVERGLDKSGVRLFGAGDITDDDLLNGMGDAVIGTVTAYFYSAAHPSEKNKAFVEAFKKANNGMRPNFFAVSGYDGMHLIYEALKKTNGSTNGDVLVTAMKSMAWESPRGPIAIDPETRDIVQNIYLRKVEKVNGELYNIEFETYEAVKDPVKAAKK